MMAKKITLLCMVLILCALCNAQADDIEEIIEEQDSAQEPVAAVEIDTVASADSSIQKDSASAGDSAGTTAPAPSEEIVGEEPGPGLGRDALYKNPGKCTDVDECEDACDDSCGQACGKICKGKDDECTDSCEDLCEDACELTCDGLKPVFGPARGSVLLTTHFSGMLYHSSSISREEDRFIDETDFIIIYTFDNGNTDTVDADFSYMSYVLGINASFFLSQQIGLGLSYEYSYTDQTLRNRYETSSGQLMGLHHIAGTLRGFIWQNPRMGFSLAASAGMASGSIHRYPVLHEQSKDQNIPQDEKDYYREINSPVDVFGMHVGISASFHFMITRILTVFGGPVYNFSNVTLQNDRFFGYPQTSNNHDVGININFGLLLNGRNDIAGQSVAR